MSWCGKAVWLLAVFAGGCTDDPFVREDCDLAPDFFLTVRAQDSALPEDLSLYVKYGGGNETLEWIHATDGEVMFCDVIAPSGGAGGEAGAGSESNGGYGWLECDLYTDGPATVTATAAGFEPVERELRVDEEECTTPFALELPPKSPPM